MFFFSNQEKIKKGDPSGLSHQDDRKGKLIKILEHSHLLIFILLFILIFLQITCKILNLI